MPLKEKILLLAKWIFFFILCRKNIDTYFYLKHKITAFCAALNLYERKNLRILHHLVKEGNVVVDVGANFGIYTNALSKIVKDKGKVYAFEPVPIIYDFLKKHSNNNNIKTFCVALSDTNNTKTTINLPMLFGHIPEPALCSLEKLEGEIQKLEISVNTLDQYINDLNGLTFIKADIEGHEFSFLRGAAEIIKKFRPVIQIEDNIPEKNCDKYQVFCSDYHYKFCELRADKFKEFDFNSHSAERNFYLIPLEMNLLNSSF